jgi:hypothetical protein
MSEKQAFLDAWNREAATTLKVLRAYPADQIAMKPHASCRSAKELAWTFVFEGYGGAQGIKGEVKWPPPMPPMPDSWNGMVGEVDRAFRKIADEVQAVGEPQLNTTVKFFRSQANGRRAPPGFSVVPAQRHDPSPRPVLGLPPDRRRQSPRDLRAVQRRAVAMRLRGKNG